MGSSWAACCWESPPRLLAPCCPASNKPPRAPRGSSSNSLITLSWHLPKGLARLSTVDRRPPGARSATSGRLAPNWFISNSWLSRRLSPRVAVVATAGCWPPPEPNPLGRAGASVGLVVVPSDTKLTSNIFATLVVSLNEPPYWSSFLANI